MNNRRKFFFNGFLLTVVGLCLRTVGLAFGAYISRTVGAEGVGLNTLIMTVYSFALTFATSGIGLTVTRLVASHVGKGEESCTDSTLRGAIAYALIFSGIATVALVCFSGFFARIAIGDARAIFPLQMLSLSLIPAALSGVFSGYFIGVKKIARNSAIQVLGQILRIALTVYLLGTLVSGDVEESVAALCIGGTIAEFITFLVALTVFLFDRARESRRVGGCDGVSFKPVFGMAMPLAISAYIRSALLSVEHSLITKRLIKRGESLSEALSSFGSLHGMALQMVLYPMSPLSSFSGLLVPEFAEAQSRGEGRRASRIAGEAISATLVYATAAAVMLFVFSEELGYGIYDSYSAGSFIALLSPVVPLMYLDHVVDSMLKGIGEHVYSMWVNIADSTLSVLLVWLLIPIFGISGYAFVIIGMEGFNFILSFLRLRKRISVRLDFVRSLVIPAISSLTAALLVGTLFIGGTGVPGLLLAFKLAFCVCAFLVINMPLTALWDGLARFGLSHKRTDSGHNSKAEDE